MAYPKYKNENYTNFGGINTKASPYANQRTEFRNIENMNFQLIGSLSQRRGTTLFTSASVAGRINGIYEFQRLNGASYVVVEANTNLYSVNSVAFTSIRTNVADQLCDFTAFVDRLYIANGKDFLRFDGNNAVNAMLPEPPAFSVTGAVGGGLSGVYTISYGYINDIGTLGPVTNGVTISLNGATFGSITVLGATAPTGFGVSNYVAYLSQAGSVNRFAVNTFYDIAGTSFVVNASAALTSTPENFNLFFNANTSVYGNSLAPSYLELFNNQMFMSGFSLYPSRVFWSEIGDPEAVDPTYYNDFRTNDGDVVTGMKFYNGVLIITKERSVHRVVGDNPDNFYFQEISDQYGCLSNRAMVVFNNLLWFLDIKGICQYNGANIGVISDNVEPYFLRMNVSAARRNATAVHYKQLNEVWFSFPIDGSTINNITIVYDYVSNAFTTYKGFNPSSITVGKGALSEQTVLYGGYTGQVINFGSSLVSDFNGSISCVIDTRYIGDLGQSVEKQFRRLFLNTNTFSVTNTIRVDFTQDYNASIVASQNIYLNQFQPRIDYGIPAKALQAKFVYSNASLPIRVDGFTIEYRFQRDV